MNAEFEWKGDEVIRRIREAIEPASGRVSLPDLLPPEFIKGHSKFDSIDEMLAASKLVEESATKEELAAALQGQVWDRFVSANSDFPSWEEMLKAGATERIKRALGG